MRNRIVIATLAAGLTMLGAGIGDQARAIDPDRAPQAPTGHRQPTARDVPAAPAQPQNSAEKTRDKMDQDLERKLKSICKGC
jgi:hypothetical protein